MMGSLILYFFYESNWVAFPAVPCAIIYCTYKRKQLLKKRKQELEQEFQDWIRIVDSGLQSGYSVENAFRRAGREIALLYGKETIIRKETYRMEQLLENNMTLEQILWDFGQRSGSEDIYHFADVFMAGKRSGGNLREMISGCCEMLIEKIETEREIKTLLHGKVTEQRVMCVVPFAIMLYIGMSSPGYFAPLYHNPAGICIMTGCLALYLFSVICSLRIVRIEV